jgi:hypothetical protein
VIGGLLAALVGARVVMMTRLKRLTRKRRERGPRPSQLAG